MSNGTTAVFTPIYGANTALTTSGYTAGGLAAKFINGISLWQTAASAAGFAPAAVLTGVPATDSNLRNYAIGVTNGTTVTPPAAAFVVNYSGLLNITTPGLYFFGGNGDDNLNQVNIDGSNIIQDQAGGHAIAVAIQGSTYLSAGLHNININYDQGTGGAAMQLFYGGPDTASYGLTGGVTPNLVAIAPGNLYSINNPLANPLANAGVTNNAFSVAAAGTVTWAGNGTNANSAVTSLTLGDGSTLTVTNADPNNNLEAGQGVIGVTGLTTIGTTAGATVNPTSGFLALMGGISAPAGRTLTKNGAGTLFLGGDSSATWSGAFNVKNGVVILASATALTTGATVLGDTVGNTGGGLDLNGQGTLAAPIASGRSPSTASDRIRRTASPPRRFTTAARRRLS